MVVDYICGHAGLYGLIPSTVARYASPVTWTGDRHGNLKIKELECQELIDYVRTVL